jgi:hypothetical protein
MRRQSYPAARSISSKVQAYFAEHVSAADHNGGQPFASLPDADTIEAIIDAAFWTSLRHEEGYVPRISLAFLAPEEALHPLIFERPLPLDPTILTRVAPAVERAGIHLGVSPYADGVLHVWGTTRTIPTLCFVLEVAAPGLLVIKHHRGPELGKFVNVAVLEGDQIKLIDEHASSLPDCPELLSSLLGFDSPASWVDSVNILVQLAVSMRAHGRGGSLLLVAAEAAVGSEGWRESIVQPLPYAVSPPLSELAQLSRETPDHGRRKMWKEELRRAVDAIAGLTAVDGAAVLTNDFELLGFGAKISRRRGRARVERVTVTEPVQGIVAAVVHPEQLGGTRHLSAAQFIHDQHDALALVASQDGRFTVFAWSPCEEMVHAHRVETLLM